jgi:L-alanine-DL-glutamate epimerase-like enolase superfamily enzyme
MGPLRFSPGALLEAEARYTGLFTMDRRDFLRTAFGASAALALPTPGFPLDSPPAIKITEVKFLRLRYPGRTPRKRNGTIESGGGAPGMTQLEIYTDAGIVGRSLASNNEIITNQLAPRIQGMNPFHIEAIWDRMYRFNRKPVAKGPYISAMGAVDIAIWDIIGKALNKPVCEVLGVFSERVRVYAAGGYYEEGKGIRELVKEMEGYVAEGFRAVKMKVGGEPMDVDAERVRAVREAIGPKIDLMIDANNRWTAFEAIHFGHMVEKYNPYWFEEPVEPDDFAGSARVRQELRIPVASGENEFTRWGARDLIQANAVDILQCDTVLCGGISEGRKIANLASAYHIPVSPHGSPHMSVHLLASLPNALIMETYPAVESQYNLALPLFPVKDGYIEVPKKPGIGIDPDPEMVKKYRLS